MAEYQQSNFQPASGNPLLRSNGFTLSNIDLKDLLSRAIKYLIEGLAVAFVAYYFIGVGRLNVKEILMLGITAAFVFAILDTFSPTTSAGVRFGSGWAIGHGLVGQAGVGAAVLA